MAKKFPKISIITTFHRVLYNNPTQFYHDYNKLLELDYPDYEIIIVSDKKVNVKLPKARFVLTGKKLTGPGEKRDKAVPEAKGEIIAFIDDDAYPDRYWLREAVKHFSDPLIGAVCGPGVTPPEDTFLQKIGGLTLQSEFCSGSTRHRFVPAQKGFVRDHPTYNFLVRKNLFLKIGGFKTTLWCGEDTKLCLSIINSGKKILYVPEVVVYHHRREMPIGHLKQISNIGVHRGYFVKKYPKTSRELIYFLPSLFTILFLLALLLSSFFVVLQPYFVGGFVLLLFIYFMNTIRETDPISAVFVSFSIVLTHLVYGVSFIKGLFSKNITR